MRNVGLNKMCKCVAASMHQMISFLWLTDLSKALPVLAEGLRYMQMTVKDILAESEMLTTTHSKSISPGNSLWKW